LSRSVQKYGKNSKEEIDEKIDLTKGNLKSLIWKLTLPASTGMVFNTLFNIVDTFFAGKIGTKALTGLALSFPLFFILIALGKGFGTGVTALISNSIGEKDYKKAKRIPKDAISLGIIISIIVTIVGYFICEPIYRFIGVEGLALDYGVSYMKVIYLSSTTFILIGIFNAILLA